MTALPGGALCLHTVRHAVKKNLGYSSLWKLRSGSTIANEVYRRRGYCYYSIF